METTKSAFLLRRLHSLSGVVPVGLFLVIHLWTNAAAMGGAGAYNRAVDEIQALPALLWLEVFGIYIPLGFHALYGVKIAFDGRPNVSHYPYNKNWLYTLQRVTGFLALIFILVHLWEYRVQKWLTDMHPHSFFDELAGRLSAVSSVKVLGLEPAVPVMALFYALGVFACVFHFANGLVSFVISWGIVVSRRAIRGAAISAAGFGTLLFATGFATVVFFATGARPPGVSVVQASEPCPTPPTASPSASGSAPSSGAPSK